jgi:hypothetical protein
VVVMVGGREASVSTGEKGKYTHLYDEMGCVCRVVVRTRMMQSTCTRLPFS